MPILTLKTKSAMAVRLPRSITRTGKALAAFALASAVITLPLAAQTKAKPASAAAAAPPTLVGAWLGTATISLSDSSIVVPVFYTFTQTGTTIGGTAMVPGQGAGTISNVTRNGKQVRFRVTAAATATTAGTVLEHEGIFGPDGALEGIVNMDNAPLAKFRIAAKPVAKTGKP